MLNKIDLITKRIFQIILYLIEVIGLSYLLASLTNKIWSTTNFIDFLERMIIFYNFYQIIIYGILQQLNDIKKDEYVAIITLLKKLELYASNHNKLLKDEILSNINEELDGATLNDNDIRETYIKVKECLENNKKIDMEKLQYYMIHYEHLSETAILNWKYSVILRIFKNGKKIV